MPSAGNYDVRVICEPNEDPHSVADKVAASLKQHAPSYVSTRGATSQADFNDVILEGTRIVKGIPVVLPQYIFS